MKIRNSSSRADVNAPRQRWRTHAPIFAVITLLAAGGCGPAKPSGANSESTANPSNSRPVQGELIGSVGVSRPTNAATASSPRSSVSTLAAPASPALPMPTIESTNGVLRLGFETLAAFPYVVRLEYPDGPDGRAVMVTDDQLPAGIRALDGRPVAIAGYVMPLRTQARGVTEFLLVRDLLACCFGANPQMNHWIHVSMPRGEFRPVISRPATVRGVLRVGELRKDGIIHSIYRLEADKVEMSAEASPANAGP